ncbi:MAG: lipoprotein [Xanthomonadales bacterium]|nr:lipoprotein [Gammaproteobacteria bacterium]MBT8054841.1 lipoprotein [Gammaproteobacteria bacterium]NND58522.1 lipoprotein [Xanthomonadales bacterium]NNK51106.1 lipoprotein [Xanthomonadales bacterium]
MKRTGTQAVNLLCCSCLILLLAACGQRGPLYLPDKNGTADPAQTSAASDETPEEEKEENDGSETGR